MAYRNLELTDTVRITDGSEDHGQEGVVIDTTGTGAKVRYFNRAGRQYMEKWFNQRNLAILMNTPVKTAPMQHPIKQYRQEEKEVAKFKIGDRVQIVGSHGFEREYIRRIGIITQIDETHLPVRVDFDDEDSDWGKFEDLELYTELNTVSVREKLAAIAKLTKEIEELLG